MKILQKLSEFIWCAKGRREGKGSRDCVKEIIAENFPNLEKELDIHIHKANSTSTYLNTKRHSPRHIILKLTKVNDNFKDCKEK